MVNGQPNRWLILVCPFNAVTPVCFDEDEVALLQATCFGFIRKAQSGRSGQQQYPFGLRLVVPEIGWAGLAVRDDALDTQPGLFEQGQKLLLGRWGIRDFGKNVLDHRDKLSKVIICSIAASARIILTW